MKTLIATLPMLAGSILLLNASPQEAPPVPPVPPPPPHSTHTRQTGVSSGPEGGTWMFMKADQGGGYELIHATNFGGFAPQVHSRSTAHSQTGPAAPKLAKPLLARPAATFSSLDRPNRPHLDTLEAGALRFVAVGADEVLAIYQELSGRTVLRSAALPAAKITLCNQTPLTRIEALQTLDTALAINGIVVIPQGALHLRAVPAALAPQETAPQVDPKPEDLPDSLSYVMCLVPAGEWDPSELMPMLAPFSRMPNGLIAIQSARLLILRDYSANVKRMLQVLERVQKSPPPPPHTGALAPRSAGRLSRPGTGLPPAAPGQFPGGVTQPGGVPRPGGGLQPAGGGQE